MNSILIMRPFYVFQFKIYNTILRKYPEADYAAFLKYDNLFSTTIFVLASAVLKISRVMPLQRGLVLYRGLGNGRAFPDSLYRADENGCTGYVEWGFMSTTARKEVAIHISKAKDGARYAKQHILAFRVGAADRGACIRDFSQYQREEEYLYVPCSFVEESGPCYDEIGPNDLAPSLIRVYPVKVNANLKTTTVEELISRKKTLHLAAFKYRIHEIRGELEAKAREHDAMNRMEKDSSRNNHTVDGFVTKIVDQCKVVFAMHEAKSNQDYRDDGTYRRMLTEMAEVKVMALSKLQEWIENVGSSFIASRYDAQLRTVHRIWIEFLEKKLEACPGDEERRSVVLQLCKTKGFVPRTVHDRNEIGETVLMVAAAEGRGRRHLHLLVESGADINSKRGDGASALWLAARFGHSTTIRALIDLKATVNEAANNRATPLCIAAQAGHSSCVRALIELKADLNAADDGYQTPLHQAAKNGHTECTKLLADAKAARAAISKRVTDGRMPLVPAEQLRGKGCVRLLSDIMPRSTSWESHLDSFKSLENYQTTAKLIITTASIKDADAMLALAAYARSGADVLLVLNYPAYVGIDPDEADPQFPERNPGLGYRYTAAEVLGHVAQLESCSQFMLRYAGCDANEQMKRATTDVAFVLATQVWGKTPAARKGNLYFCIGGINSVNPFPVSAIKNDVLAYSTLVSTARIKLEPRQGAVYNSSGSACVLELMKYSELYLDFNGPMSHWNESWQEKLGQIADRIRGVFIMGGVYANKVPVTSSSIPDVLNRFSSATMNQLYHPQRAAEFFSFVAVRNVSTFVIPSSAVDDLSKKLLGRENSEAGDITDRFIDANAVGGEFLKRLARAHCPSQYKVPLKPSCFCAALALVAWLDGDGAVRAGLVRCKKSIFYSSAYGLALVSELGAWEEARDRYALLVEGSLPAAPGPATAGECLRREIEALRSTQHLGRLRAYDVGFGLDEGSLALRILPADQGCTSSTRRA